MGKREDLEAKLLDIQGHTVYLPYDPPEEEELTVARREPNPDEWCAPIRGTGQNFSHRRMLQIWGSDGMQYLLLECLDGATVRTHNITYTLEEDVVTHTRAVGVGEPWGFMGRMNFVRINDALSFLPFRNLEVGRTISVDGLDWLYTIWPDGEYERTEDGTAIFLDPRTRYYSRAIYVTRDVFLDIRYLLEQEGPGGRPLMPVDWTTQTLSMGLVGPGGDWMMRREPTRRVVVPQLESPLVATPSKHRHLITDLRKSLLSEKWSGE